MTALLDTHAFLWAAIWQCLQRDWTLLTKDRELEAYRALGLKTSW